RFGEPRTVAGLPVRLAILGLGKMGGVALGYASDIEILLVYSDSGSTGGPEHRERGILQQGGPRAAPARARQTRRHLPYRSPPAAVWRGRTPRLQPGKLLHLL